MALPTPTLLQRSLFVLALALFVLSCDENKAEAPQTFTVTFNANGDSAVDSRTINKDAKRYPGIRGKLINLATGDEKELISFIGNINTD